MRWFINLLLTESEVCTEKYRILFDIKNLLFLKIICIQIKRILCPVQVFTSVACLNYIYKTQTLAFISLPLRVHNKYIALETKHAAKKIFKAFFRFEIRFEKSNQFFAVLLLTFLEANRDNCQGRRPTCRDLLFFFMLEHKIHCGRSI